MARWTVVAVVGVAFHCAYMLSALDMYFRSPIVHGMRPHSSSPVLPPPARRVVLFVGDGLRADKFFEQPADGAFRAPFLRSVIEGRGAWGVSHARMPTESRPCHVAMLAGLYEDVSAVTRGWKSNPVAFDSVFNRSSRAWGYGSPDIVPMFSNSVPHMHAECYGAESEDFGVDAGHLDEWVFERVEALLGSALDGGNMTARAMLETPRSVWLLHLLGLDTLGHSRKPHSREYLSQITAVDAGVRRVSELFDRLFPDNSTAFLFTADHGMSPKGSHGDGDPVNTRTPFVAWGAGVRGPQRATDKDKAMDTPPEWRLDHLARVDFEQASIAPLMATLVGADFPVNSIGVLPLELLSTSQRHKAEALYGNALQVLEMYHKKNEIRRTSATWHTDFGPLAKWEEVTSSIETDIREKRFEDAEEKSRELINTALEGLRYLQTYDWWFLVITVFCGYTLWMAYVAVFLTVQYSGTPGKGPSPSIGVQRPLMIALATATAAVFCYLFLQSSPFMFYVYISFPVFFLHYIVSKMNVLFGLLIKYHAKTLFLGALGLVLVAVSSLFVVVTFYERKVISCGFALLSLWPAFTSRGRIPISLSTLWAILCFACGIFPFISADLTENTGIIMLGGLGICLCFSLSQLKWGCISGERKSAAKFCCFRLAALAAAVWVDWDSSSRLAALQGLPLLNQILSWSILCFSLVPSPKLHPFDSLNLVFLQFAPAFIILTVSYEVLFLACLGSLLSLWVVVQARQKNLNVSSTPPKAGIFGFLDIWGALIYMFLCFASFFCTGNIASISSFEVSSTYRLTTVFSPFLMSLLLLLKILIPFIFVASAYRTAAQTCGVTASLPFLASIALSGMPAAACFLLVKDTGSWKDIGMSIGNFAIGNIYILLQLLLMGISALLVPSVSGRKSD